jgi:hypothetical protein
MTDLWGPPRATTRMSVEDRQKGPYDERTGQYAMMGVRLRTTLRITSEEPHCPRATGRAPVSRIQVSIVESNP